MAGSAAELASLLELEELEVDLFRGTQARTERQRPPQRLSLETTLDEPLDDEAAPSVLMLARAAGYKVFWISNQHDRYINPRFAEEADVQKLLNVGGKRGDRRLDEALIPEWQAALRDPAPRKLIIAHLLGAHPHYELRYPKAYSHYVGVQDEVSRKLADQGRMPWIRVQRDQYDNAMRYQDHVIATLLRDFQRQAGASAAFLFTSDHGQDVGHMRNFAGHSTDMPGMVVPLLLWRNDAPPATPALQMRAFQNDVLDWTLLDLLDVQTRRDRPELSLIDPAFAPRVRAVVAMSPVEIAATAAGANALQVRWQGCADAGLCYPPQTRTIAVSDDGFTLTPTGDGTRLTLTEQGAEIIAEETERA